MTQQRDLIAVVGRANIDLTVRVGDLPSIGRVAFGSPLAATAGGKALNQAVAIARLGGQCCLIANAGADHWGDVLNQTLTEAGVDAGEFRLLENATTGAAIIEVTPDGESYIVLALSPTTELTPAGVVDALTRRRAGTVVTQMDLPVEVLEGVLRVPHPSLLIGNLVPWSGIDSLFSSLDAYVVNEYEAASVLGVGSIDADMAVKELRKIGPRAVVVTAGEQGAFYGDPVGSGRIAAPPVEVVDTSGAGDAFLGALALELSRGEGLRSAVIEATRVGGMAVRQEGALLP